ncbi:MAG: hypothetical protein EOM91_08885 [Sphingobacteriia bacterium]|nr:hypothetical protein [Sphingobacteriia bacterium]NCC37920.1 hypothetical protein [Gammaproteobacteria bacterium]
MIKDLGDDRIERVDAAFNRVLAAEVAARERVAACREQAEEIFNEADARVARIDARVESRIGQVQRIAAAKLELELAALCTVLPDESLAPTDARLEARLRLAIAALADEIIGMGMAGVAAAAVERPS